MADGRVRGRGKQAWRDLVERHSASGLTVAEFCRREGVCAMSFYRWKKQLAKPQALVPVTPFVALGTIPLAPPAVSRFELRLDLGNGMTLSLTRS